VSSTIRAVLFDWGDTLFHAPDAAQVLVEGAYERGVRIDLETARRMWGDLWTKGKEPDEIAKGRDLSPEAHREVWTALFRSADVVAPGLAETLYERVMEPIEWLPYPDTAPTLRALKAAGRKVGVVSNVAKRLRPAFERHGMAECVDAFVLSYEHGAQKPEPRLFERACVLLGVEPADALMVGDHPLTDGGAASAGLTVLILPGVSPGSVRGLDRVLRLAGLA
jgi:HAD superfamily hydrolase (TIGR01509 family)